MITFSSALFLIGVILSVIGAYMQLVTSVAVYGVAPVLCVGYAGFLALLLTDENYPNSYKLFDKIGSVLLLLTIISIFINIRAITSTFIIFQMIYIVFLLYKFNFRDENSYFSLISLVVALLAWIFYLFSLNANLFPYAAITLILPFSIIIFSRMLTLKKLAIISMTSGLLVAGITLAAYLFYPMKDGVSILILCAHALCYLWIIPAFYMAYFGLDTFDNMALLSFIAPLLLAIAFLCMAIIAHSLTLMHVSSLFFILMIAGIALRRYKKGADSAFNLPDGGISNLFSGHSIKELMDMLANNMVKKSHDKKD